MQSRSVLGQTLSRAALATLCVAGVGAPVLVSSALAAEELFLRPAFSSTSYIRTVPNAPVSDRFVLMIRQAVQHADSVQAAAARSQAERFGVDAAAAAQLPTAVLYSEAGMSSGNSKTPYTYGVRVSVPIYDGNSAGYATEAQFAAAKAARYAASSELASTLVDLVAAAAAIRRADEILGFRHAHLKQMKALLASVASERETGTASKVDTDQIEAELAQIEIEVKAAEATRIEARETYAGIAATPPPDFGTIGSIARFLPDGENAAIAVALAENPQLAHRFELASAAQLRTDSVRATLGPDLSLDFSAGRTGDLNGAVTETGDARAMFRLELPLSFGGDATVQRQALEAQAAQFEVNAARTGVVAGITSAYDRLQTTRESLSLAYDALDRTRTMRSGMQVELDLGERTLFDMITAQDASTEAEIRVASLRYDIVVAEHLLAAQIGRIDDIYGAELL